MKLQFFDESKKKFCFVIAFSHYKDKTIYFQDIYMLETESRNPPNFLSNPNISQLTLSAFPHVSSHSPRESSTCLVRDVGTARTDPHICTLAPASSL